MRYSRKKKKNEKKPKPDFSDFENTGRYKFLEYLGVVCPTPNWQDFFWYYEDRLAGNSRVVWVINIDFMHNQQLGLKWSHDNTVHIRSLGVANDERGVGFLSCLCSLLIRVAEESGVFLYGTARPFRYDIPRIETTDQALAFIEKRDNDWWSEKENKDYKKKAASLRDAYLKNGFCRYDSSGFSCGNKFWKTNSFGYLSSNLDISGVEDYFANHLSC